MLVIFSSRTLASTYPNNNIHCLEYLNCYIDTKLHVAFLKNKNSFKVNLHFLFVTHELMWQFRNSLYLVSSGPNTEKII